jgi:hypothetical protein
MNRASRLLLDDLQVLPPLRLVVSGRSQIDFRSFRLSEAVR